MSTEVQVAQNTAVALPQHLAALFAGKSNLVPTDTTPSLTYKGKTFSVNINGAHKQLLDGDGNPLPMVEVIILNANPRRSRTFFAGKFVDGEGRGPDCHSYDGKRPANEIEEPQSNSCETCAQAVKGSKTNDKGQPITACQLRQRISVVPSDKPDFEALLVNMASTSAYDKDNPDANQGWHAFDAYKKELTTRGIPHTAAVKTKIRFAPSDAFPRLQFKFAGLLDEAAMVVAAGRIESEEVMTLLNKDFNKPAVEHKPLAVAQPTLAAPVTQPEVPTAAFGSVEAPKPQPAVQEAPKAVVAPVEVKVEPAPVVQEAPKPVEQAKPAPKPAAVVVENETDLNSILSAWD